MHEFLTYFLSHIPAYDNWVAFLLVNTVAYLAARNTVVRQQRQLEKKVYTQQLERLEADRLVHIQWQHEQQQLLKEQRAMIQRQANQLHELTQQLDAVKQLHLN
jgi:hypothetical protein